MNKLQKSGFEFFFQEDVDPLKRENIGLQYLFNSVFPFSSNDESIRVEFSHYTIGKKLYSKREAILRDKSYVVPIRANIRMFFQNTEEIKEQEIFICDFPYMTDDGTFVINGDERAVVSQMRRSPGVVFDFNNRAGVYHSRLIPEKGPWIEFEIVKDVIYVRIDKKARIPVTMLMRALGFVSNEEILSLFEFEKEKIALENKGKEEIERELLDKRFFKNIKDENGEIKIKSGVSITNKHLEVIRELGIKEVEIVSEKNVGYEEFFNTFDKDSEEITQGEACKYFYYIVRGIQPNNEQTAINEIVSRYECLKCGAKIYAI